MALRGFLFRLQTTQRLIANISLTFIALILWFKLRGIKAFITIFLHNLAVLPFIRKTEIEADIFGLYMTANACYDVSTRGN
jgi:Zn-dependent protease with chaperone function